VLEQYFVNSIPGLAFMYIGLRCKKAYDSGLKSGTNVGDKKMKRLRRDAFIGFVFGAGLIVWGNWVRIFMTVTF